MSSSFMQQNINYLNINHFVPSSFQGDRQGYLYTSGHLGQGYYSAGLIHQYQKTSSEDIHKTAILAPSLDISPSHSPPLQRMRTFSPQPPPQPLAPQLLFIPIETDPIQNEVSTSGESMMDHDNLNHEHEPRLFISSDTFDGFQEGYEFKTDNLGTGYYLTCPKTITYSVSPENDDKETNTSSSPTIASTFLTPNKIKESLKTNHATPTPTPTTIIKHQTPNKSKNKRNFITQTKKTLNLRHEYCQGLLSDRGARRYLREQKLKTNPVLSSSPHTKKKKVSNKAITKKKSSMKCKIEEDAVVVVTPPRLIRSESIKLRHRYCKGLLSDRASRRYFRYLRSIGGR